MESSLMALLLLPLPVPIALFIERLIRRSVWSPRTEIGLTVLVLMSFALVAAVAAGVMLVLFTMHPDVWP